VTHGTWCFSAIGGRREAHAALEGADQRVDLVARDQPLRLRDAGVGLTARVAEEQLDLGPAERLDAARGVDVLDGHGHGVLLGLAKLGSGPGERAHDADADLVGGLGGRPRHHPGHERQDHREHWKGHLPAHRLSSSRRRRYASDEAAVEVCRRRCRGLLRSAQLDI
jgi:hypothetical protein